MSQAPRMTPAEELAIVEPDVDLTVRDPDTGEAAALTVREFRFREGLAAQQIAAPLIAALTALAAAEAEGAAMPEPVEIDAILGENAELWLQLIARACDREADWLGRLGDEDARAVSGAMWTANGQFFFRRVVEHATAKRGLESLYRSLASWMRSPPPDTETTAPSESA